MDQATVLPGPRHELGECGRWVNGELHWVDIPTGNLWHRRLDSGMHEVIFHVSEPLGAVAPIDDGRWIAACGTGFAVLDGNSTHWLYRPEHGRPMRMNDGCADPAGRFIAGSMSTSRQVGAGSVYRLDTDGTMSILLTGITTPNGPAFSLDGKTMYLADTRAKRIDAYDYEPGTGSVGRPRPFMQLANESGSPDGMTVDDDGNIWCAIWGAAQVHQYTPTGRLRHAFDVPVQQPTSCTFGGPDGSMLFVTSARAGLAAPTPDDGAIVAISGTGSRGRPAARVTL